MKNLESNADLGFTYFLRITHPDGRVEHEGPFHNLTPIQGCNYLMGTGFKAAAQITAWYLTLYENAYTPTPDLTAAAFPALAGEVTAYESATRPAWVPSDPANGAMDNSASPASFVMTQAKTVYGGAMLSSAVKGSTNGVIASAVQFSSPKVLAVGTELELIAGNTLISN